MLGRLARSVSGGHAHSTEFGCVEPIYRSSNVAIYQGDALIVLPRLASASVNAVIADPPCCHHHL